MTVPRVRATAAIGGLVLALEAVAVAVLLPLVPDRPLPAVVDLRGADGVGVHVPLAAVSPGWAAVVLLAIGAVARFAVLPVQEANAAALARNRHPARWWEWSFTLPITVFLLAQLNGIAEVPALVLVYAVTAGAVLTAALQEIAPAGRRQPLMLAAAVGIVPWGVIAFVQIGAGLAGHPPSVTTRVLTLVELAAAALLLTVVWREQARADRGEIDDRAERAVSVLGVVALSAFAWLVVLGFATGG